MVRIIVVLLICVCCTLPSGGYAEGNTINMGPYVIDIDNSIIYGISYNTSLWQFQENLDDGYNDIVVYDASTNVISGGTITNSMSAEIHIKNVKYKLDIVVNGDTDRNGTIDSDDISPIREYIINRPSISPLDRALYDVNMDGSIDIEDIISVQKVVLGNDDSANAIVNTCTRNYSYDTMVEDIQKLVTIYPKMAQSTVIGQSVFGRDILCISVGNKDATNHILIQSGMHAREHMTSMLVMDQAEYLLANSTQLYKNKEIKDYLANTRIHFIPMTNPDGIMLVQQGIAGVPEEHEDSIAGIIAMSKNGNFASWKSNARGIDLNRNFDASYNGISNQSPGAVKPAFADYGGAEYFTEPESIALRDYTLAHDFDITISYHSTGEMIYWFYNQEDNLLAINYQLACTVGYMTGYRVLGSDMPVSTSGYKDWAVLTRRIPSLTVEIGNVETPLPYGQYRQIWAENRNIPLELVIFNEVYSQ